MSWVNSALAVIASASMVISASANTYIDKDGNVTHEKNVTDFMVYVQDSDGNYKLTYDYYYVSRCEFYGDIYSTPGNGWFAYNDGVRIELGHDFSPTKRRGKDSEGRRVYFRNDVGFYAYDKNSNIYYGNKLPDDVIYDP